MYHEGQFMQINEGKIAMNDQPTSTSDFNQIEQLPATVIAILRVRSTITKPHVYIVTDVAAYLGLSCLLEQWCSTTGEIIKLCPEKNISCTGYKLA